MGVRKEAGNSQVRQRGFLLPALAGLVMLLTSSCAAERRLAAEFVVREDNIHVLLLPPPGLIKTFRPGADAAGEELAGGEERAGRPETTGEGPDLAVAPRFLEGLNDSAFVDYYLRSLKYHLENLQIRVYGEEDLDHFLQRDGNAYIFSMAQVELLEFPDDFTDLAAIDTVVYRVDLPRTNLELSSWFEFSPVNDQQRPMEVLYSMQSTSDFFEGRFVYSPVSGQVTYRKTSFLLETADVYDLAYFAGEKNAAYLFDYLMNRHVRSQLRPGKKPPPYLQYDVQEHAIRRAYNDRFIVISPEQEESSGSRE